jgi:demethylmenaquinone methyltransferase/2-methoxy-6-polyprenyl-1,4-benzoquinol methylase
VLEINRARVGDDRVTYVQADLSEWEPPPAAFDVCFFSFWLSHVPESRFAEFWQAVRVALRPAGRVFLIDSARSELSAAPDQLAPQPDEETVTRQLDDGSEFQIIKRFYEPRSLERMPAGLGWRVNVRATGEFFIFGAGSPLR